MTVDRRGFERQDAKTPRREPEEELDRGAYATIGAAIEVHRHLGPGFLEAVYEEAMFHELRLRGIDAERQVRIPIDYKGIQIAEHVLDFVVEGELVVELEAIEQLTTLHHAQVISYLKAGAFELGLLINFNVPVLKHGVRRIIANSAEGAP